MSCTNTDRCTVLCRLAGVLLLSQIVGVSLLLAFGGLLLAGPSSSPEQADLIVILGGGTGERLVKGGQLFQQGYGKYVLITGMSEENMAVRPKHTNWRSDYLEQLGVPGSAIIQNSSATNTWQEARLIKGLMLQNRWNRALIVSDPPHLFRLSWVFARCFASTDLSYRFIASEPDWWNVETWWGNSASASFVIEEVIKILYYWFEYE